MLLMPTAHECQSTIPPSPPAQNIFVEVLRQAAERRAATPLRLADQVARIQAKAANHEQR